MYIGDDTNSSIAQGQLAAEKQMVAERQRTAENQLAAEKQRAAEIQRMVEIWKQEAATRASEAKEVRERLAMQRIALMWQEEEGGHGLGI